MCSTSDTFSCMVFYGRKTLGMNIKLVRSSKIVFLWRCYQSNVIQLKFQNACIASVVILQNIFITSLWSSGFCKSSLHFFFPSWMNFHFRNLHKFNLFKKFVCLSYHVLNVSDMEYLYVAKRLDIPERKHALSK